MRYYDRTNLVEYNWFYQDCCLWILHNFQDKYTLEHYWTLFVEVNVEVLQIWRWLSNNECHYSLNVCAFTTFLFLRRCLMSSITLLGFSSGYLLIMRYITSVTVSHHIASNLPEPCSQQHFLPRSIGCAIIHWKIARTRFLSSTQAPTNGFSRIPKKVLQLYWNHTSAWVFTCKFAAYFKNTFS